METKTLSEVGVDVRKVATVMTLDDLPEKVKAKLKDTLFEPPDESNPNRMTPEWFVPFWNFKKYHSQDRVNYLLYEWLIFSSHYESDAHFSWSSLMERHVSGYKDTKRAARVCTSVIVWLGTGNGLRFLDKLMTSLCIKDLDTSMLCYRRRSIATDLWIKEEAEFFGIYMNLGSLLTKNIICQPANLDDVNASISLFRHLASGEGLVFLQKIHDGLNPLRS